MGHWTGLVVVGGGACWLVGAYSFATQESWSRPAGALPRAPDSKYLAPGLVVYVAQQ